MINDDYPRIHAAIFRMLFCMVDVEMDLTLVHFQDVTVTHENQDKMTCISKKKGTMEEAVTKIKANKIGHIC